MSTLRYTRGMKPIAPAVLIVAALLAGCRPGGTGPADPELAAFVPGDAVVLVGVRLERIRATPLGKRLAAKGWLEPPGVEARDLLASWNGSQWLTVARGRLRGPESPGLAAAGEIVLAGSPAAVRTARERHARGTRPPSDLLDCARAVPPQSHLWAVTYGAPALPDRGPLTGIARLLNAMEDIRAWADLSAGLRAAVTGNCRDERNAGMVEETLRGFLAIGQAATVRKAPELASAYQAIRVQRDGRAVRLDATIPPDAAEKLLDSLMPR